MSGIGNTLYMEEQTELNKQILLRKLRTGPCLVTRELETALRNCPVEIVRECGEENCNGEDYIHCMINAVRRD